MLFCKNVSCNYMITHLTSTLPHIVQSLQHCPSLVKLLSLGSLEGFYHSGILLLEPQKKLFYVLYLVLAKFEIPTICFWHSETLDSKWCLKWVYYQKFWYSLIRNYSKRTTPKRSQFISNFINWSSKKASNERSFVRSYSIRC